MIEKTESFFFAYNFHMIFFSFQITFFLHNIQVNCTRILSLTFWEHILDYNIYLVMILDKLNSYMSQ